MDIKVIYINADGLNQEHSESADSIKLLSLKTANHELTDTKLGELIAGGDGSNQHNHDSLYFRETEHVLTSSGAPDAGKPVILDAAGKLEESLLDIPAINGMLDHGAITGLGDDDHTQYILVDGTRAFSGDQSMGGFKLTNLANPVSATDAVNLQTLQAYQEGLKPKEAVRVATIADINLASAPASIDGVTLASGDRVLVKEQSAPEGNGIYIFNGAGSAMTRADDFDSLTPIDEINGAYTMVQEGTLAGRGYVQTGVVATLGTSAINFVFFNAAELITASTGLEKVINDIRIASSAAGDGLGFAAGVLSVNVDDASIEINADAIRVKALGIKDSMIDFGTGAGQVSAADMPIADAGNYFPTDNVEAALQQLAQDIQLQGVVYTVGLGGVNAGDLVYVNANNQVVKLSTITANEYCIGVALETKLATESVKILANDTILAGVLSGATAGQPIYWTGSGLSATAPTGSGQNVWRVGVARNASDLHVEVSQVKKNA